MTFRSLRTEFFKNRKNYSGQFYYGLVCIITDQIKCLKIADTKTGSLKCKCLCCDGTGAIIYQKCQQKW